MWTKFYCVFFHLPSFINAHVPARELFIKPAIEKRLRFTKEIGTDSEEDQ